MTERTPEPAAESAPAVFPRAAVVGCGTIGASWAGLFSAHGVEVSAYDPNPGAEERLRRTVEDVRRQLGRTVASPAPLRFTTDLAAALADAPFVQENGPDSADAKIELLGAIDAAAMPDAIVASSTSSQLRSVIVRECRLPDRHIVAHPFNPPHLIPLVEIVGGAEWAVDEACRFYRALGRRPIVLKREMRGHIANRLTSALWREALHILDQDAASVADIDDAVRFGPGLRWAMLGPHLTYHLAGGEGGIGHFLDHLAPGHEQRWADLGSPKLMPELKAKLVEGVLAEAGERTVDDLARERDEKLVALRRALGLDESEPIRQRRP